MTLIAGRRPVLCDEISAELDREVSRDSTTGVDPAIRAQAGAP